MYAQAYLDYLYFFHAERDYFECHEVLETEWKKRAADHRHSYWVTLIQLAVALYHERRGNKKGAHILLNRLLKRIPLEHVQLEHLGINTSKLLIDLHIRLKKLDEPFSDYDLPLTDSHLIKLCQVRAGDRWKSQSPLNNPNIIHKHILRHQKPKIEEEE